MHINIHIQRPVLTLMIAATGVVWFAGWSVSGPSRANADAGGVGNGTLIAQAEQDIDRQRITQEVLAQREEILRYQLTRLEEEALQSGSSLEKLREVADHRTVLLAVLQEREQSEKLLADSLTQLWEAQGTEFMRGGAIGNIRFTWPVPPLLGISARFEDADYEKRFKVPHHAIDIPVDQGTLITAPADGTVVKVALNGLGYSYVTLSHRNGFETIYGHISAALVQEGDTVRLGQAIARSGGMPGSVGAGLLTTGPHLHFAVRKQGKLVDPMLYLEE